MAKWKLFNRSKTKEDSERKEELPTEHSDEPREKPTMPEFREESKQAPIKEYNETLYSRDSVQKPSPGPVSERKQTMRRTSWESSETIEHNIDGMARTQREQTGTANQTGDVVNKKVDFILLRKKGRH